MNGFLRTWPGVPRGTAAFAFAVIFLVTPGGNMCSPNPNWTPEPRPTPAISAQQAEQTAALLIDALLEQPDLPPGTAVFNYEESYQEPDDYQRFIALNGWTVMGTSWRAKEGDVFRFDLADHRFAFADAASATAYMNEYPHANKLRQDWPTVADVEPGTYAFADLLAGADSNREIQLRTVVGRIVLSLVLYLPPDRADWREYAFQLLELARQRTREALSAAGE